MTTIFTSENAQNILAFFKNRLTLIDFLIMGLGVFLIIYQLFNRFSKSSKRIYQKAQQDDLYLIRVEVTLDYIAALIELLPMLGLLGTVWGLMNALAIIATKEMPTITDIATYIAPAISTTFFGLTFALINLLLFDFIQAYFTEIIAWCRKTLAMSQNSAKKNE